MVCVGDRFGRNACEVILNVTSIARSARGGSSCNRTCGQSQPPSTWPASPDVSNTHQAAECCY
eukprot:2786390-Prorocentrum_lima.AAC.1